MSSEFPKKQKWCPECAPKPRHSNHSHISQKEKKLIINNRRLGAKKWIQRFTDSGIGKFRYQEVLCLYHRLFKTPRQDKNGKNIGGYFLTLDKAPQDECHSQILLSVLYKYCVVSERGVWLYFVNYSMSHTFFYVCFSECIKYFCSCFIVIYASSVAVRETAAEYNGL